MMNERVKDLLKRVFPLALLRQAQYQVNRLRIRTLDKLRFPERLFAPADYAVYRQQNPFQVVPVQTGHLDPRLQRQFEHNRTHYSQEEYVLVYAGPCVIEPYQGWAMSADNQLIYPSLGLGREEFVHKPDGAIKQQRYAPLAEYAELISLRDTGEENYFHFFNDVLGKLFLLEDELQVSTAVPILISRGLYERPFFQQFLTHQYLRDRTWVVQDCQYVRSYKTYFCKPLTHRPDYYPRLLALLPPAPQQPAGLERRIFITRNPKRLRFIENNAEVAAVCAEFDFETVDFDEMSFLEQVHLMAQARYVVGIHGAGLTNILFRGALPLGLLELYPPSASGYYPFHYALLAEGLNYQYDGLIGGQGENKFSGGFRVDLSELRQRVTALLQR